MMSSGYDYGNARLAARRAWLPGGARMQRLVRASGPGELLALLGAEPGWKVPGRAPAAAGKDARAVAEDLLERWRAAAERDLLRWYDPPQRLLVEALVMPLDAERVLEILRRRRAGLPAQEIARHLAPGALLGEEQLQRLAQAPSDGALFRLLAEDGLVSGDDAERLAALAEGRTGFPDPGARAARTEARVCEAVERSRAMRARGRGSDAALVRAILAAEVADRRAVAAELALNGPTSAAVLERALALARWRALERRAHRDPLGVEPVAAYVAAVELAVVRLRALLARLAGVWLDDRALASLVGSMG